MKLYTRLLLLFCCSANLVFSQSETAPNAVALQYLRNHYSDFGLQLADVAEVTVSDSYFSENLKTTHVWLQQSHQGVPVHGALLGIHVQTNGQIVAGPSRFIAHLQEKNLVAMPALSASDALDLFCKNIGIQESQPFEVLKNDTRNFVFAPGQIAEKEIHANLQFFQKTDGNLALCWHILLNQKNTTHSWAAQIDAQTGAILDKKDLTLHCNFDGGHYDNTATNPCIETEKQAVDQPNTFNNSGAYRVFPLPVESPTFGNRALLSNPDDPQASPYGWHDINGQPGAEYTYTRGNNTRAYEDSDNNNLPPATEVDGGAGLVFDFPFDPNAEPITNKNAAVTNLFYLENMMHDISWHYGFDGPAGNYQENNYNASGLGGDPVIAEALDGSGFNNAIFFPTPDGDPGRTQMYTWSGTKNLTVNSPSQLATEYLTGQTAGWGAPITNVPVTGEVAIVDDGTSFPTYGCFDLINDLNGKIAMIDRGDCQYGTKALNAQNKGAIGCIICNYENQTAQMTPGNDGAGVSIPVVMLRSQDCAVLRSFAGAGLNVSIVQPTLSGPLQFDGAFDNGIISHEYGHGISNRLTGGPSTHECLTNGEQMGEGWSDFIALAFTAEPGDAGTDPRGLANYVLREGPTGSGLRRYPYTTDMSLNPLTYGNVSHNTEIHALGEVWTAMLWDLYWAFVDQYGFDPDVKNGIGGNNKAIQLIMDGMKFQPCWPGFVDGRDALIQADIIANGGQNICLIHSVFARRGLGYMASQGSSDSAGDQTESFEILPVCTKNLQIHKSCTELVTAGAEAEFYIKVSNYKDQTATGITVTDVLPTGLTYVPGSASNGGILSGSTMIWNLGTLGPGQQVTLNYRATTDIQKPSIRQQYDDVESGDQYWYSVTVDPNITATFSPQNALYRSGTTAWKASTNVASLDFALRKSEPIVISGNQPVFRFWHAFNTEAGYDGGFLEISTNNGQNWTRVPKNKIFRNTYTGGITYLTFAIPYLDGWSGYLPSFKGVYVDLSDYIGQSVLLRFRAGTSEQNPSDGWYIDDVEFMDMVNYNGDACVTTAQGDNICATAPGRGVVVESAEMVPTVSPISGYSTISIFPNPATSDAFLATGEEINGPVVISIYSLDGALVVRQEAQNLQKNQWFALKTHHLPTGAYIVRLESNQFTASQKLIKY